MASSVWKGSIVLSLVSIPVRLYAAARSERTYLHQIHDKCNTRVRQPLFCPTCNRFVNRDEIIKGYEYEEGQYVLMKDDEIKKLAAQSSSNLEISAFTKLDEIDPIFFDSSYFCLAEDAGKKGYHLLVKALEDTETIGIGKLLMHQRDYTVFLRPYQHGLLLHTMYFSNEIRSLAEFGALETESLKPQEVKLTEQLIRSMTEKFKPAQYHEEFQEKLKGLIEAKRNGQGIEIGPKAKTPRVVDMMAALKKSLATVGKSPEKSKTAKGHRGIVPIRKAS